MAPPRSPFGIALILVFVLAAPPALPFVLADAVPAPMGAGTIHTYDEFSSYSDVGSSYEGFTYTGASTLCAEYLNTEGYPPTSGTCLVYAPWGTMEIAVSRGVTQFTADFATGYPYFGDVSASGYDAFGNLVAQTTCRAPYGTTVPCTLQGAGLATQGTGLMTRIVLSGGSAWGMDTAKFPAGVVNFGAPHAPSEPLLPVATPGPGGDQITIAWSPPADYGTDVEIRYDVYRGTSPGGPKAFVGSTWEIPSYTDWGLQGETTYYYDVTASNSVGTSPHSAETSATTFGRPGAPLAVAAAPGPGSGQVTLTWAPPQDVGGTHAPGWLFYNVYRSTSSGGESHHAQVWNAHAFTDSGLDADTTYHYRVSAVNAYGEGPRSDRASASPYVVTDGPRADVTPFHDGHADEVHYEVGLVLRYGGRTYDLLAEGTHHGPLPFTTPAYPKTVHPGPDRDGDGVPGALVVRYQTTTVGDDGSVSSASVAPVSMPLDPDDADDSNPKPKVVDGPYAQAMPVHNGDAYATHYKVGAKVRYAGQDHGQVLEGTVAVFHDADGDFVPDEAEATLCANENPNFSFDGTCAGSDYSAPTVEGILDDLEKFP